MGLTFPYSELYGKNVYVNTRVNIRAIPYEDRATYKDEKGKEQQNIRFVAEKGTSPGVIYQLYTNPNGLQWFGIKYLIGGTTWAYAWIQIGPWIDTKKFKDQGARTTQEYNRDKEREEKEQKEREEEEGKTFGEKALDTFQTVALVGFGLFLTYKVIQPKIK